MQEQNSEDSNSKNQSKAHSKITRSCARDEFLTPFINALNEAKEHRYKCKELPDEEFFKAGLARISHHFMSGRELVQFWQDFHDSSISVSRLFDALKSNRRLKLLKSIADLMMKEHNKPSLYDPFKNCSDLDNFAIYAGDGHSHAASVHEDKVEGKKYAPCHLYMVNLRNNLATHMDVCRPKHKKEHEMSMLKRIGAKGLRMNEPIKRKVIIIYDRAVIDFRAWQNWKQSSGVYIITESKCNMAGIKCSVDYVNKNLAVNAGVTSCQSIGTSNGVLVRKIKYKDPASGKVFDFITNEMTLEPGHICYMYKMRWNIEKVFDTFKNTFYEQKAWAKTEIAKSAQGTFITLIHNLIMIIQNILETEENCTEEKIIKGRLKEIKKLETKCKKEKIAINPMLLELQKSPQVTKQFTRWLLVAVFMKETLWDRFVEKSRGYMANYIT